MAMLGRRRAAIAILALAPAVSVFGQVVTVPMILLPGRAARLSVLYSENAYTRVITPPALPDEAMVADDGMSNASASSCNAHVPLGSDFVEEVWGGVP